MSQLRHSIRQYSTSRKRLPFALDQTIHGFHLNHIQDIPEFGMTSYDFSHLKTGAQYIHMDAQDKNNVFSIHFRTPPADSTGVAHILEHTVLCGSQRYPVRDPFFNMLKRSLNTFMNAMTGSDQTTYPFSTTNKKDFYNLMQVYLDASFFPLLEKQDFRQEGHRLDYENDELVFKGVVYNEMKGVLSDSSSLFSTRMQQMMFPGTTYEFVSGGDPVDIPDLTWEELRQFHKKHYHPSNSLFFSYGDISPDEGMKYLNTEILNRFDHEEESAGIQVKGLKEMGLSTKVIVGPPDAGGNIENQVRYCEARIVGQSGDAYEAFVMQVISYLLFNGPSSPMYRALIDSKLGSDFVVGTGFDNSTIDSTFCIGVQGTTEDKIDEIKNAIKGALQQVALEGFDSKRIAAVLHQIELGQKHKVGNFGLRVSNIVGMKWTHRCNPTSSLMLNQHVEKFRCDIASDPCFLRKQVVEYLLKNDQVCSLTMIPQSDFNAQEASREKRRLQTLQDKQEHNEIKKIKDLNSDLILHQEKEQDVDLLPTLAVKDIPRDLPEKNNNDVSTVDLNAGVFGHAVNVHTTVAPTNEISYFRTAFDASTLLEEDRVYLPVFSSVLSQLGAGSRDHYQLANSLESNCGGINFTPLALPQITKADDLPSEIFYSTTFCLPKHANATMDLMQDILADTHFTNYGQLSNLLSMHVASVTSSVAGSGHAFAQSHAASKISKAAKIQDIYGGVEQLQFLQQIGDELQGKAPEEALQSLSMRFNSISKALFRTDLMKCGVVAEAGYIEDSKRVLEDFIRSMGTNASAAKKSSASDPLPEFSSTLNTYIAVPVTMNYVAQCFPTVPLAHSDHAPLSILAQILSSCFLHQSVREKGGAYGCSASQSDGTFNLVSYYDPNTTATLDAYKDSLARVSSGSFSERDIVEAKLAIFGEIDSPSSPSAQGRSEFLIGLTDCIRQQRRERLLDVTRADLIEVAQKYLTPDSTRSQTIVGPETDSFLDWKVKRFN